VCGLGEAEIEIETVIEIEVEIEVEEELRLLVVEAKQQVHLLGARFAAARRLCSFSIGLVVLLLVLARANKQQKLTSPLERPIVVADWAGGGGTMQTFARPLIVSAPQMDRNK